MAMKKYISVEEYILNFEPEIREKLEYLRETVKKAAPEATESVSYGMPVYKLNGVLVYFGAFKNHISLFPGPKVIEVFEEQLKDFKTSKGTIQFPFDKEIPFDLVREIVQFTREEKILKSKKK
jgi:uncharacterized protein YdhG (YjbR/CyaY superfamily)